MQTSLELAADYYLVNFRQLLGFVGKSYASLLTPAEQAFERDFQGLPVDAQKLYVRLLCRSKSLFRMGKLNYPEISDLPASGMQLATTGFVSLDDDIELHELLPLFTRAEIMQRVAPSLPRSARRPEIDAVLLAQPDGERVVAALLQNETLVQVHKQAHFDLFRLCFFGNLYQDMTAFVLRDLGLTRFEGYPINNENLAFQSRDQVEAHLQYYACTEDLETVLSGNSEALLELYAKLPDTAGADANLTRRVERVINTLARQMERLDDLDLAMQLYQQTRRPPSRERRARVLVKMEEPLSALDICREMLKQPINDQEKQFAEQFGARLAKSLDHDWIAPARYRPPDETLQLQPKGLRVELLTAEHYAQAGACFYTENVLFTGVFGLVFWDIIFTPVKGVFFNPFQHGPADFYEPEFRQSRESLLRRRWSELSSESSLRRVAEGTFVRKQGLQNPLVQWQYLPSELLELALSRIPLTHWLCVFHRLLDDLRYNRNGFPDLVSFPKEGGYCLIEVKGPGDTLQKNQLRWMAYFFANSIPHKVAQVSWLDTDMTDS